MQEDVGIRSPSERAYTTSMTSVRTIQVLSVHNLPEKGFETKEETWKAYSTFFGGFIYMAVSG